MNHVWSVVMQLGVITYHCTCEGFFILFDVIINPRFFQVLHKTENFLVEDKLSPNVQVGLTRSEGTIDVYPYICPRSSRWC